MDYSIKAQKFQAIENYEKAQFVYNLIVYSLTAFLSCLFYSYLFWFPSMRHFFFDLLPNIYAFLLSPIFLFILGNVIVIILVGESKLSGSRSSPATEIYDEYVERSRSLRRQSFVECEKKDGRPEMEKNEKSRITRHCSLNNIRCLEVKKKETVGRSRRRPRSIVEHKKEGRLVMHENEKRTVATQEDDLCNIRSLQENKEERASPSLKRPQSLGRLDMHGTEKTTMATPDDDQYNIRSLEEKKKGIAMGLTRPQSLGRLDHMHENIEKTCDGDNLNMMFLEDNRKEMEQSMDELNRRVEEFIARVNRQRMLEARELDSSQD